jgi:hypothetical protein
MKYSDLLFVWAVSITWCTVFLIAVSFYLYHGRKNRSPESGTIRVKLKEFLFVLVLACLLGLYILSINLTSSLVFAIGNIIVEIFLVGYTMRNKTTTTGHGANTH